MSSDSNNNSNSNLTEETLISDFADFDQSKSNSKPQTPSRENKHSNNSKAKPKQQSSNQSQAKKISNQEIKQNLQDQLNQVYQKAKNNKPKKTEQDTSTTKKDPQTELNILKQENQDLHNKYLKSVADLQNLQKQFELDLIQKSKSTKKKIVLALMPFLNAVNLSFSFIPQTEDQNLTQFVNSLKASLEKAIQDLKLYQVEIILPKIDEPFSAETMSILNPDNIDSNSDSDLPKIKQVVSLGVKVDGQVIQPVSIMI